MQGGASVMAVTRTIRLVDVMEMRDRRKRRCRYNEDYYVEKTVPRTDLANNLRVSHIPSFGREYPYIISLDISVRNRSNTVMVSAPFEFPCRHIAGFRSDNTDHLQIYGKPASSRKTLIRKNNSRKLAGCILNFRRQVLVVFVEI